MANQILTSSKEPTEKIEEWNSRLQLWTPETLAADEQTFRKIYRPISILPPDQYHALVVQITQGCSYNRCLFCDFYRDRPFHIQSLEELQTHLIHLKHFFGPRITQRGSIFLADGNALVVPTDQLMAMLELIRQQLGHTVSGEFHTFMDTFTLERKSIEELRLIFNSGLRTVYTGLETGSNRLRKLLRKPGSAEEAVHALNTLKEAGFRLGVILLVGVGGPFFAQEHLDDTLRSLKQIQFTHEDTIFLSPFVTPDQTDYRETTERMGLKFFTDQEIDAELKRWRQSLAPLSIKITQYSLKEYIYS